MQAHRLANGTEAQTDWNTIDWKKANRSVRNLRQRIFRATQEGNLKKVRSLQNHAEKLLESARKCSASNTNQCWEKHAWDGQVGHQNTSRQGENG